MPNKNISHPLKQYAYISDADNKLQKIAEQWASNLYNKSTQRIEWENRRDNFLAGANWQKLNGSKK